MSSQRIYSKELIDWRRKQLLLGGRKHDLDWLLDLGGGLSWTNLQSLYLDEKRSYVIVKSLEELSRIWKTHLDENIPLQYLIGKCPWRDFELEISPVSMIPRQETELLVDFAIDKFKNVLSGRWADLGTGSGALAIALARKFPLWEGFLVDISQEALLLARRNIENIAGDSNYSLHCGFWWEPLKPWWGSLNLVLANPPYIPESLLDKLDPIVIKNEPTIALLGGKDGLNSCRDIISGAFEALSPGGCLMLEHHYDQSDSVLRLMHQSGLIRREFKEDLEGIKRFAIAFKPNSL